MTFPPGEIITTLYAITPMVLPMKILEDGELHKDLLRIGVGLARLAEKLTHRGLIYYGVYLIAITSGLKMCATPVADITIKSILEEDYANPLTIWNNDISPMDIKNDVCSICSFSLNNIIDGSHMQDLIPSSWGESSATCSTHSEYHSHEMNLSSSSSTIPSNTHNINPKFGDLTKVEAVVPHDLMGSHSSWP